MSDVTMISGQAAKNTTLGRYQLMQELGQGAAAVVFKAYDPQIDRTLAVKVLRSDNRDITAEFRKRFTREARAAGSLNHPNIVIVHDVGEWQTQPYMVMEWVQGTPLDKVMAGGRRLPLAQVIDIGVQLAEALHYAHQHGIVHRDIKPANIIRMADSNKVKITDFGIAQTLQVDGSNYTKTGQVLGTPQYMSPEQVLGLKMDGRSDLFSLGVVLYQMLSGQRAFTGETLGSLFQQITTQPHAPLLQVAPDVPPSLAAIIDRLLAKEPRQRWQTGAELAQALRAAAPVAAEQRTVLLTPTAPGASRFGKLLWVGLGVLLMCAAGYAVYLRWPEPAPPASTPPAPQAEGRGSQRASVPEMPAPPTVGSVPQQAAAAGALSAPLPGTAAETTVESTPPPDESAASGQPPATVAMGKHAGSTASAGERPRQPAPTTIEKAPLPSVPQLAVIITQREGGGVWQRDGGLSDAENRIMTQLMKSGLAVQDAGGFDSETSLLEMINGNRQSALLQRAAAAGVSHLLLGQLQVRDEGAVAGSALHSYQGSLSLRLLRTSDGRVLDIYSQQGKQADNTVTAARQKFYRDFFDDAFRAWLAALPLSGKL